MRGYRKNIALVFLSLLVSLVLSEILLSVLYPQKVAGIRVTGPFYGRYDPQLGWANQAGASGLWKPNPREAEVPVSINAKGLRGTECPYERTRGRKRILVIGDSLPFGFGVAVDDSFPEILRGLIGEGSEVVNASVVGYGLDQSYLLFLTEGIKYRPDLVLVKFSTADIYDLRCSLRFGTPKPYFRLVEGRLEVQNTPVPTATRMTDLYAEVPLFDILYTRSHLYRLLFHRFSDPLKALTRSQEVLSHEDGLAVAGEIIRRMEAGAKAIDARLVILAIPHQDWLTPGGRAKHGTALDLLRSAGVAYIDLWDVLSANADKELFLAGDNVHFSAMGHRVIAQEIRRVVS